MTKTLDTYLKNLKFVVLKDLKTGNPLEIHFGFHLPDMHSDIFADARKRYASQGREVGILGGGRITKLGKHIVFHGQSLKYGRYEDDIVLTLAPQHPEFCQQDLIFLSKAGEDNAKKVLRNMKELS